MQPAVFTNDELTGYYTTAIDALCEIVRAYFFLGRLEDALHVLRLSLSMREVGEVAPAEHLKLLLLSGRVLTVEHLLHRGEAELMFSTLLQARQLAEAARDQQGLADILGLLGQAHCNATTVAILKSGGMPFDAQSQGTYEDALAYQQQALALQEVLHDTRGISEAQFGIGLIQQFRQQHEVAREHFARAIEVAEQAGYVLEQAEPNRHLSVDALFRGDLDRALTHAQRALALREAGGFRLYQPLDHLLLRDIYLRQGNTARAQFHLQQASTLAEEMGLTTLVSAALNTLDHLEASEEG